MKSLVHIALDFKDGPWGGGNQFLKALRNSFLNKSLYVDDFKKANIVLFNSHHHMSRILKFKYRNPEKIFIHRIDGPIFFIRNRNKELDELIFEISEKVADFTVFQSKWSLEKCRELGFKSDDDSRIIIHNAPDKNIFNTSSRIKFDQKKKIRIIATSWSGNMNKGFDAYKYMDENLNFNKYEFIFIGNSPIKFKNIKHIPPLDSNGLAQELKKSDIFITASKNDPCSNSLIEALSCGLPALACNSGGHPELIGKGGEVFETNNEIIEKLEKLSNNYFEYQKNIPSYDIDDVGQKYIDVFKKQRFPSSKSISTLEYIAFLLKIHLINFKNKINFYLGKLSIK